MVNGHETAGTPGERNQRTVLRQILLSGPIPRIEIAARVGLTASAVTRIAQALNEAGLVREMTERRDDAERRLSK